MADGALRINWYRVPLNRETLAALNTRSNARGLAQSLAHLAIVTLTGGTVYWVNRHLAWPWLIPALFLHGTFTSFLSPGAASHELSHGTVFRSQKLNEFFRALFAFLSWTNPVWFRASHARHHQYTLHPPQDLEVTLPRKYRVIDFIQALTLSPAGIWNILATHIRHSFGMLKGEWEHRVFPQEDTGRRRALFNWARLQLAGHTLLAIWFGYAGQWILLPVIVFPLYGGWLTALCAVPQHIGLRSRVPDFRLICRTMVLNPVPAFLYWQMNYHTEHHMYPGVPFHQLRKLHELVQRDGGPPPDRGLADAWREIIMIQRHQRRNPGTAFDAASRGAEPVYVPQEG